LNVTLFISLLVRKPLSLAHLFIYNCQVCISDINVKQGTETCKELQTEFGTKNVIFVKCDVTSEEEMKGD